MLDSDRDIRAHRVDCVAIQGPRDGLEIARATNPTANREGMLEGLGERGVIGDDRGPAVE